MKVSDFVSTSAERDATSRELLHTEETDAVNSGLVESADKSGRALKGAGKAKRVAKGKASSAVLATAGRDRRGKAPHLSDSGEGDDAVPTAMRPSRRGSRASSRRTRGGSSAVYSGGAASPLDEGKADAPSPIKRKHRLKDAVAYVGTRKALEGTELEGADDLYYKGRFAGKATRRISYAVNRSDKKVVQSARSARDDIFKKMRRNKTREQTLASAQSHVQAASYGKRATYETAEKVREAAAANKTATAIAGSASSSSGVAAVAAAPTFLLVFLALVFFIVIAGAAGQQSQQTGDGTLSAVESQVASFLMGKGLDELHTAAIMGNMYAESGMNPAATESGGTGIGICQWSFGRANNLRRYAAQQGKGWDDLGVQLDFFWDHDIWSTEWSSAYTITVHQVDGDPAVGESVSGSKSSFLATDDLTEAVESFCYGWERPGVPRINVRLEAAQRYYTALTTGGLGGGQDYASAEQWQKDIVDACHRVGWPGASLCATWTSRVYAAAGYSVSGNGNSQLGHQGYGASYYPSRATTDLSQIKVGMLVSAQYGSNTSAGNTYGHVAIYIGDGMVMDSVTNGVRTISLSDWVSSYNRGWVVCGYPWDWR